MVELTTYIQQWTLIEAKTPMELSALALLSKEEINKMEKMKSWTKSTLDSFNRVIYNGDMGIFHVARMHNEF